MIRKKLLLDRLAVAAHREPRSCAIKTQRESSDSRSASRHARALIRAARQDAYVGGSGEWATGADDDDDDYEDECVAETWRDGGVLSEADA